MRILLLAAMFSASVQTPASTRQAAIALQNSRVRIYRTVAGEVGGIGHGSGVVVWLQDGPSGKAGRAIWLDDVAAPPPRSGEKTPTVIVQLVTSASPGASTPQTGSKPGDAPFTGMSFNTLFENAHVSVLRARMDVGAREGFHTHASDTVVVHLSGGEIEDTADGRTIVNRWKPGDVEFEARGSSHSARNLGHPVEVVLVALKP